MALYKRGGIYYCDITKPDKGTIRKSLGTKDKREAEEIHDKIKQDLIREFYSIQQRRTFDEACLRYLEEKIHKKSLRDDKSRMRFWLKIFSQVMLQDITKRRIQDSVADMKVSPATKKHYLTLMKTILNMAVKEWEWLEKAPHITMPTIKNDRVRWLTQDEASKLIEALSEPFKSVVIIALFTGLRRSNIINLEWSQINMQNRVIWIGGDNMKNGRAIGVPINDTACEAIKRQIVRHNKWVFAYVKQGVARKMRVDDNYAFRKALVTAGISDFRFHDLRHTWASWLIQSGVPVSALQEMGGWESQDMVKRYAHLSPQHLKGYASKIDGFFIHTQKHTHFKTEKCAN